MRAKHQAESLGGLLEQAQRRIAELETELERNRIYDPATGLFTRPAFRARLDADVTRCQRYGRPLSVAVLDIDGFRAINANHGLAVGDQVLAAVADAITSGTREPDLTCHASGDEFILLLPETNTEEAAAALQRILRDMETLTAGPLSGISVSVGVAGLERRSTAEQLLDLAGKALARAQAAGGGRVAVGEPGEPEVGAESDAQRDVVAALASALLARDRYTGEHSESVVEVAGKVASSLGLDSDEVNRVRTAALLHDIGKVAMPDDVLNKEGPLDEQEWKLMREHPVIGERILRAIPGLGSVARIVRHEHERWDGTGYPDGLSGESIPIGARIILGCDAYHAMTSDRPYRPAMPHADAVHELTGNAGTQFDPRVVEALVGHLYGRRQAGVRTI